MRKISRYPAVLLVAALAVCGLGAGGSREGERFAPVAVERIAPLPAGPVHPAAGVPRAVAVALPEVDEEDAAAGKARAAITPTAEPADSEVALPAGGPRGAAVRAASAGISFDGLDRTAAANNGQLSFPPDTTLAKSGFRLLQGTNSALRLFTPTGGVLATRDLNTFFDAALSDGMLFDPKVLFDGGDPKNRRLYVAALQFSRRPRVSVLWLAVSRQSNPGDLEPASWCRYRIDAIREPGTAGATWADHTGLGVGLDALVVTTNQYRFSDNGFTFPIVRALDKRSLAANASACPALTSYLFQAGTTAGDRNAFSLQPVAHLTRPTSPRGAANPAYLVSTARAPAKTYRVWRLSNLAGGSPKLEVVDRQGTFTYDIPPNAPQPGGGPPLQTGDHRIVQAVAVGDTLWAAHTTLCTIGGSGGANASCIRLLSFQAGTGAPFAASLVQQLTFAGGPGVFYWMPGIAVTLSGQTAVAFQGSSPAAFLGAYWTLKAPAAPSFPAAQALGAGACAQTIADRTGDYLGVLTNPNDLASFWLAGERTGVVEGSCVWQTRIAQVAP